MILKLISSLQGSKSGPRTDGGTLLGSAQLLLPIYRISFPNAERPAAPGPARGSPPRLLLDRRGLPVLHAIRRLAGRRQARGGDRSDPLGARSRGRSSDGLRRGAARARRRDP